MSYVLSLGLSAVGLLLLLGVLMVTYRALRRFRVVQEHVRNDVDERSGLLRARAAGLRVAFAERRRRSIC
ncbi:bacteriophage holin [Haloactinomyces albus]|uniref:Uncharacterized protein n=1 Tax=Haloactinomyces albus TaxID=1352928 RepID=A0AAE3ZID9_9ACTN|nr:bacteriophage holin [Haloactinomyces albus]MDR7303464.1 hypothetical protein [Haloactinomyces albus]